MEEGEKHFDSISAEWVVPVDGELERQVVWEKGGGESKQVPERGWSSVYIQSSSADTYRNRTHISQSHGSFQEYDTLFQITDTCNHLL